jgi:AraC family transcriptional regulator
MSASNKQATPEKTHLSPGQYFGEIIGNQRCCDLVLTEVRHTRGNRFPRHSHELAFFSLLLDGSYTEQCGRKSIDYKQLMVVYRPPAVTHSDRIGGSGVRLFNVEIKDSWLERMRQYGPVNDLSLEPIGGELCWLAARLYRQFREKDPHSPLAIEGLILEMLAILGRNSRIVERQLPGWLSKVREILHAEYSENVSIQRIADEVGLEPYYLSKIFRRFQNQTIAEYVQELRVKHASNQLLDPEAELSEVALAAGFSDQSHLTRIFKRVTGMTPGAFRSALIMNPGLPAAESELER